MSKKNKVKITKERKKAKKIISTILDCAVLGINLETNKINYCDYVFAYALEYFMNWGQLLYQVDEKKISKIEKCYNFVTQCRNNESGKIMLEGKDATVIVEALEILGQKFLLDDLEFEEANKPEKSIVLTPRIMIDDLKESFLDKMEMYCQIENYVTKNYPE